MKFKTQSHTDLPLVRCHQVYRKNILVVLVHCQLLWFFQCLQNIIQQDFFFFLLFLRPHPNPFKKENYSLQVSQLGRKKRFSSKYTPKKKYVGKWFYSQSSPQEKPEKKISFHLTVLEMPCVLQEKKHCQASLYLRGAFI